MSRARRSCIGWSWCAEAPTLPGGSHPDPGGPLRRIVPIVASLALALATLLAPAPAGAAPVASDSSLAPESPAVHDSVVVAVAPAPTPDYLAQANEGYTAVNRAYNQTRVALALVTPLVSMLILLVLLFSGLSRRFREIAHGLGHTRYVRVLIYFTLYAFATYLMGLPLAWFGQFAIEHQYGLTTQTFGGWLGDSFKELVFDVVALGVVPLLALAWAAVEASPRGWWWRLGLGTLPVAMAATLLQPIVFEPLFNKFTPLHDAALRDRILALAARARIPARHVYEVDMSTKTKKINAYVSGFGASQRIVLWDTTLRSMRPDEILVVMGHEMGHYALRHVWTYLWVVGAAAFLIFFLAARLAEWLVRVFGERWGVTGVNDLAAMPALALALGAVLTAATPGFNALGRRVEHEADVYALEITHDNDAAARAFLKLAHDNRSDPEPPAWVRFCLLDHPPLGDRIRFALRYKPWEQGEPNRFFRPGR